MTLFYTRIFFFVNKDLINILSDLFLAFKNRLVFHFACGGVAVWVWVFFLNVHVFFFFKTKYFKNLKPPQKSVFYVHHILPLVTSRSDVT